MVTRRCSRPSSTSNHDFVDFVKDLNSFRGPSECPSDGPLIASLIRYGQLDVVKALLMAGADSSVTPINLARVFEMEALARMGSEPVRVHADCR